MSEFEINDGHEKFDDALQSFGLNLDLEVASRDGDVDGCERALAAGEWVDQRFVVSSWWLPATGQGEDMWLMIGKRDLVHFA